ncbi:S-layer homology domain-containing protein [Bacillus solitudinis]|uniref:S-layer homology domain-containing protein n=1 Tax=Bacillus solitudinis TaxID=2014074 RepID=UPI000C24C2A2|nr:S-layer homology domain-containing protein [Bacillus solitudinis]
MIGVHRKTKIALLTAVTFVMSSTLAFNGAAKVEAAGQLVETFQVSPGVKYVEELVSAGGANRRANVLNVSLTDPFTKLGVNAPQPFSATRTTTQQAKDRTVSGYRVVGAVNATFFNMTSTDRMPFSIIAERDHVINYGIVSTDRNFYRSEPIAFGVKSDGKATVDHYEITSKAIFNSQSLTIHNVNYIRDVNELIVYTPSQASGRTGTNSYGAEVIVRNASKNMKNLKFGDKVTGTVEKVTKYGEGGNAVIPADGFVLSGHGAENLDKLGKLKAGDQVEVTLDINSTWKGAELILGSGPQLVRNGQVNITMNESNWRASQRVARTGVGVDSTGNNVFMVTVSAMTMREFANYMVTLGADRALNFDGGGSTTMAARRHGQTFATLANRPSDGTERRVSATLQAVSTAPLSKPATIRMEAISRPVVVGSTVTVKPGFALDEYYNSVTYSESNISFTVTEGVGEVNGLKFRALKAGEGRIRASYDGSPVGSLPIKVVSGFDSLEVQPGSLTVKPGTTQTFKATAKNKQDPQPIFDSSLVEWKVQGNIGTIDSNGRFVAGNETGSGTIIASFNGIEKRIPVLVSTQTQFKDVPTGYWAYNALLFLKERDVLRGYSDGTVQPSSELTRAQAAAMLVREFNLKNNGITYQNPGFSDIATDYYAYDDIKAIAGAGLMTGKESGRFDPNGKLTRAQMAAILTRAYKLKAIGTTPSFPDVSKEYWAYSQIEALATNGLTGGYADGRFGPGDHVTRAQFAVFLERAIKK